MAKLWRELQNLTVRTQSPDGNILASLANRSDVEFSFRADSYQEYEDVELAYQLTRLGQRLLAGWLGGRQEAFAAAGHQPRDHDAEHWDARTRRFEAARSELDGEGLSAKEWVCVESEGLHALSISVGAQVVDELDEEQFLAELSSAVRDWVADVEEGMALLKREYLSDE